MAGSSRIPGFYKLSVSQRRERLVAATPLTAPSLVAFDHGGLPLSRADTTIENVVGTFALPLGVAVNFQVNGEDVVVPMAVEEPSVVAAASNMARIVRKAGGFRAETDQPVMIGQVQLCKVSDVDKCVAALEAARPDLIEAATGIHPFVEKLGGGLRGMSVRHVRYDEPGETPEDIVVLHFLFDCRDAMGANMVNTIAEQLAPYIAEITGETVGLRILSNLASERRARASCRVPVELLDMTGPDGETVPGAEVAEGIASAYRFAWADPWRAATHNKGIMNGIDPVVIATGNDWRAIEAGAHAWAAVSGRYRSLTSWKVVPATDAERAAGAAGEVLEGRIELPMQLGVVGGTIKTHPAVRANLELLGNPGAQKLAGIIATVGLAQNMGALRALATEGIQRGHMRMHARSVAVAAGAQGTEIAAVVDALCSSGSFTADDAAAALARLRTHP